MIKITNEFTKTYERINDLVEKCLKDHKDHKYPEGVFCDTRYIAEITGKMHKNVLRDVETTIENLRLHNKPIEVAKFEPHTKISLSNDREVDKSEPILENTLTQALNNTQIEVAKFEESGKETLRFKNVFYIQEFYYYDDRGNKQRAYYMNAMAYLVMMGRYNDTITFCLATFFYNVMRVLQITIDKLLKMDINLIDEAGEIVDMRDSGIPYNNNTYLRRVTEFCKNVYDKNPDEMDYIEYITGSPREKTNLWCYATTLDVWRITGKTEHNKVTRDVKNIMSKLKVDGFEPDDHFKPSHRKLENGRSVDIYELDEIAFLTLMGHYYDHILYDLSKFYTEMKDKITISAEGLLSIKSEVLTDVYECLRDISLIQESEYQRINRNFLTDIDYQGMSDDEIYKETGRIWKENRRKINKLLNDIKEKYKDQELRGE